MARAAGMTAIHNPKSNSLFIKKLFPIFVSTFRFTKKSDVDCFFSFHQFFELVSTITSDLGNFAKYNKPINFSR